MQKTWVQSLFQEDSTYHKATKPVGPNYWSQRALEPVLQSERSHPNKKAVHHSEE